MSLSYRSKIRWLTLPVLALCLMVQAYAPARAQAPPVEPYQDGSPVKPGDLTIEEVIEAHKGLPEPTLQQPLTPPQQAAAPLLTNNNNRSTASDMLMQGMKSVLQESSSSDTSNVKPPQMPGLSATSVAQHVLAPPAIVAPVPAANVAYQPGQAPKNLNNPALSDQATAPDQTAASESETISTSSSPPPAPPSSASSSGCVPHTETWVRKCADAGYPDEFTGEIKGETRTTCPAGALQDVWLANSCAPPEEGDDNNTAPAAPAVAAAATASEATVLSSTSTLDASCGGANGLAAAAAPNGDLCAAGEVTSVSGSGPWLWSCRGLNGGVTVSCAAPVAAAPAGAMTAAAAGANTPARPAEDGQCGASDGIGIVQAPVENLCAKGMASRVSGEGPWTWACSGTNGGTAAPCTAPKKADGQCGAANGGGGSTMPISDLCNAGYASAVTGEGPWNWTCSGLNGGAAATCLAAVKRDAICGVASFIGHKDTPRSDLCSVGTASTVNGAGPWLWTCDGLGGGVSVSCTADVSVSGMCGAANGVATPTIPVADDLCARGKPSRVTGNGPWAWNCVGNEGGDTQSCAAPRDSGGEESLAVAIPAPVAAATAASIAPAAVPASEPVSSVISASASSTLNVTTLCGPASELAAFQAPSKDLCRAGTASNMTGNGPWKWTCSDGAGGHTANCSTLTPGSFPKSAETTIASAAAPATTAAENGSAAAAVATAIAKNQAVCGAASGQGVETAPSDDLCAAGKPSAVKGNGPWKWTCGAKGKQKVSCEAPKLIDAVCGKSNGAIRKTQPIAELCKTGVATAIQGNGPWLWSCVGAGGGISVSCSAGAQSQTRVDGACGAAASNITTTIPAANLCDSGVASRVYGEGPWTWTCSGLNGGIASSCSAQKNIPPAPAPPGPMVNGLCGSSNGAAMLSEPVEGLCDSGTTTAVSGNGPWNWNCLGENGGMTVSCTSLLQPPAPITGVCGAASGVPTLSKPQSGLCAAGISSAVSGKGPWTWSCSGTNGGGAVACIGPTAGASGGALPSLVTPAAEAPAPAAAPSRAVSPAPHASLVTPRLNGSATRSSSADVLSTTPEAVDNAGMPVLPAAPEFPAAPIPSDVPVAPALDSGEQPPSGAMPTLPQGAEPLQPPPVRDTLKPSPALKGAAIDSEGNIIPGNHFTLDDDVSTLSFARGAENIDTATLPTLDKLASVLQSNSGVRITLTAYADASGISPREARRLSLTRALAVRDYLTAKGISSSRIDVRALGANVPSGDADRVDVKAD